MLDPSTVNRVPCKGSHSQSVAVDHDSRETSDSVGLALSQISAELDSLFGDLDLFSVVDFVCG